MGVPDVAAVSLLTFARDHAFFQTLFFSGDRANDPSTIKTQEILRFPQDDGLLFNHMSGENSPRRLFEYTTSSESCPMSSKGSRM
jgi:hypothetical protein